MSFQKLKNNSYCVGQEHYSSTKNLDDDLTFYKSAGEVKLLVGQWSICITKKSMIVSDYTIQAERLGDFFENPSKKGLNVSKKMSKNVLSISNTSFRYHSKFCYSSDE